MSIVAVRKEKNKITLASDSQETWGESAKEAIPFCKIKKIEDDVYIGLAGNGHVGSLFCAYAKENSLLGIKSEYDLINYVKEFNSWADELISAPPEMPDITATSQYFIIIKDRVFQFNNFYIREIKEGQHSAIGIGAQSFICCMRLTDSIEDALKAIGETDIYCNTELDIIEIKIGDLNENNDT